MEMDAFGCRLRADEPESQKRFPIDQLDRLRIRKPDRSALLLFCLAAHVVAPTRRGRG